MMHTFKGIADFFDTCSEKEFIAASLAWMIMDTHIKGVLARRAEKMKADLKD